MKELNSMQDELLPSRGVLPRAFFFVHDRPYCIWSRTITFDNQQFLGRTNASFYKKLAKKQLRRNLDNPRTRAEASIECRLFWHHAVETFVTLAGACIQAPQVAFAYFQMCKSEDSRHLAQNLQNKVEFKFANLKPIEVGWEGYFTAILSRVELFERAEMVSFFARAITDVVRRYLTHDHQTEYNSLKHGFRLSTGSVAFTLGNAAGDLDAPDSLKFDNQDSSALLRIVPIDGVSREKNKIHLQSESLIVGWDLQRTIREIYILSMMIENTVGFIRAITIEKPRKVRFSFPDLESEWAKRHFDETSNITTMTIRNRFQIPDQELEGSAEIKRLWLDQ